MEQLLTVGIKFIFCCFDMFMLCIFLQPMFIRRIKGLRFGLFFAVMSSAVFGINAFQNSAVNFIFVPLIMWAFAIITWKLSLHKSLVYVVIFYIVFVCGKEMAFEMLYRLISSAFPEFYVDFNTMKGMGVLFVEYVLSFVLLLFVRRYTAKIQNEQDSIFDWYLLIMPIASIMILLSFVFMDLPQDRVIQLFMCGGAFLLYFSNVAIFVILAHHAQMLNQSKVSAMISLKRDMEKSNFEAIEKNNELYRRYMHDIHQYFSQFRSLALKGEDQKIVHIIEEWEEGLIREEKSSLYTESPVLNSILENFENKANQKEIEIHIFVEEGIRVEFIKDTDKISLFGNLLENAIEAAEKAELQRRIEIELYMGNSYMLIFQIKNTWNGKSQKTGEIFYSMKKEAEKHGLGIGIARSIADKYGGTIDFEEQERWIITTLMISNLNLI